MVRWIRFVAPGQAGGGERGASRSENRRETDGGRGARRLGTRVVAVRRSVGYLRVVGHTLGQCRLAYALSRAPALLAYGCRSETVHDKLTVTYTQCFSQIVYVSDA